MASRRRKITILISNYEINMMEDYLVCELSKEKEERCRRMCLRIWGRLVKEWDKPNIKNTSKKTPHNFQVWPC